jgi:hypothetical protein
MTESKTESKTTVPVGDCSTTTPEWLDRLARRLSDQEREWITVRIHAIGALEVYGELGKELTESQRAELLRLQDELRTGYRASASKAVR